VAARVLAVDPIRPASRPLDEAAAVIRAGRLVAFPTETVYGLGANALDRAAVRRIFEAKGRPSDDPLIVHVGSVEQVGEVAARLPDRLGGLAARFWPGPLTLVVPRGPAVPLEVTAGRETVAVRVPRHPVALGLIERAGRPIAAPSANLFARPSPTLAAHVLADLGDKIDLLLDGGPTEVGVESTVLDLTGPIPRVLRPGGVTGEELRAALGDDLEADEAVVGDSRSPGTAERHYSPRARLDLFDRVGADALAAHARALLTAGQRVGALAWEEERAALPGQVLAESLGPRGDLTVAAARLYVALRALDEQGVDAIVAAMPPPGGLGTALRDRLRRAASGRLLEPPKG
jgi:L-threonylcarbamoyladenylate synthase